MSESHDPSSRLVDGRGHVRGVAQRRASRCPGRPPLRARGRQGAQDIESFDEGRLRLLPDGPRRGRPSSWDDVRHLVTADEPVRVAPSRTRTRDRPSAAPAHSPRARRRAAALGVNSTGWPVPARPDGFASATSSLRPRKARPASAPAQTSVRRPIAERMLKSHRRPRR